MKWSSKQAFSLVELLITLALILIMVAMFTARSSRSRQQRDLAACEKNLHSIYSALLIYSGDNAEKFPAIPGAKTSEEPLSLLVPRSTTSTEMFICPGTKDSALPQGEPFGNRKISYAYYMGWQRNAPAENPLASDRQKNELPKKAGETLFSGSGKGAGSNHHKYGGKVLFNSGEVKKSGTNASFDLVFPTNITLLPPKS